MRLFGLIGFPLGHSLSASFFEEKFIKEGLNDCTYKLFPLNEISGLNELIKSNSNLRGLNVTIPHKMGVLKFLDKIDPIARQTEAVNCIRISYTGSTFFLEGFNTDVLGFENSLSPYLTTTHKKALILGTGGSSKAVAFALNKLNIDFLFVSRKPVGKFQIGFPDLERYVGDHLLIINTTPVGMFPNIYDCLPIPYELLSDQHVLFDLIYNPQSTLFLRKGQKKGAIVVNGMEMFKIQAQKSWEIWNE